MELEKVTEWDFYDHIPDFPIRDAAYFWLGFTPPPIGDDRSMPHQVEYIQNAILAKKAAVLQKEIEDCYHPYQAPVSREGDTIKLELPEGESRQFYIIKPSVRIDRKELLELANQYNMKPEFLFPEQRNN